MGNPRYNITELELREIYKKETGFKYSYKPMSYILWRREWINTLGKLYYLVIFRNDPEAYPTRSDKLRYAKSHHINISTFS